MSRGGPSVSELSDLYQEVILDHYKHPRNCRKLPDANATCEGENPLCGDQVRVYLKVEGDRIRDIAFEGTGCAISQASASLMTAAVVGKTRAEAEALFHRFHTMVTGHGVPDDDSLGKLVVFSNVSEFPVRVKCATLAWHTMKAALGGATETVSTE